ncbi:MAG TPA: zinc-binding dehydrogenase [Steroidobacteraceae bacterium]|nr:zinc-binding dehydrogenase [Steroidobacteraceae bacterium]
MRPRHVSWARPATGSRHGANAEFERLNQAIVAAKLDVTIAAEYPLAQAAQAHERLQSGDVLGKVVLRVR